MDALSTGLVTVIILLAFKAQIKAAALKAASFWPKKETDMRVSDSHRSLVIHANDWNVNQLAELNHIKGQLQTVLQHQQHSTTNVLQEMQDMAKGSQLKSIHDDVSLLFERLNMVHSETIAVKETLELAMAPKASEEDPAPTYLKALANLAQGTSQVLERQDRIESQLLNLVTVLNSLTQRV